ncbi:MAG TPA: hypothetical protein VEA61_08365 [Allosphingosinicella sp.]|nr:hypothetical protein [Allosphingosinicella sp.]
MATAQTPSGAALTTFASAFTNGARVKSSDGSQTFLLIDGLLRLIPDAATSNNLFGASADAVNGFGPPLTQGAYLANQVGEPSRYLIVDGTKRHVLNPQVWDEFGFSLQMERSEDLSNMPDGPAIS